MGCKRRMTGMILDLVGGLRGDRVKVCLLVLNKGVF